LWLFIAFQPRLSSECDAAGTAAPMLTAEISTYQTLVPLKIPPPPRLTLTLILIFSGCGHFTPYRGNGNLYFNWKSTANATLPTVAALGSYHSEGLQLRAWKYIHIHNYLLQKMLGSASSAYCRSDSLKVDGASLSRPGACVSQSQISCRPF
jgi:hypothetical protein